ncbi:MAG: response regulator [Burkholderiales bacterium]|nr:response regulator [Burkholderiales bacterium]MDE1926527.1 response regulator [Burkholderiales bacterium]MDE2157901.1 response regulator [Burkholderiales bacterium]MDE2503723.1 response regulator [Burkholderiales bacterium]
MSATDPALSGTVLCIEDEPVCMTLVEVILAQHPAVRLIKATGGRDGLHLARSERPDLVLLDMKLPDISGLQVVRELSELIAERALRVVLLTSDSFSIDVVKALSLGAQEYWHKPLTSERLTIGLSRALEAVRRPAA